MSWTNHYPFEKNGYFSKKYGVCKPNIIVIYQRSYYTLKNELLQFNPDLAIKKNIICQTKSDVHSDIASEWNEFDQKVHVISSVTGDGLDELVSVLISAIE